MSAVTVETASLMEDFAENEQNIIFELVKLIHEKLRESRGDEYLNRVQGVINQLAADSSDIIEEFEYRPLFMYGSMNGQIKIATDFNAPLDDFKEYM